MLVWVIYDISKDSIRNRIVKLCKKHGLYRVQKSAFLGTLNRNEWETLGLECREMIEEQDSVYIFPMCEDCYGKITLIGQSFDRALVRDQIGVMVL